MARLTLASKSNAAWALVCVLIVFAWQSLTVRFNYAGNWTALFCTGDKFPVPPALAAENIYRLPNSYGWDGQFYHYMAHDPFLTGGMWKYIDVPGLRYRRILVPALAYLLALGNSGRVDTAYRAAILLFFGLGAYWLSLLAGWYGHSRAWGLAFACIPAAIPSMDRMAVDVALAAFVVAFALCTRRDEAGWKLYPVLLLAGLARETGLLLAAAYCIWLLFGKRFARAVLFATAVLPALAWYRYVDSRTDPFMPRHSVPVPFSGLLERLLHPLPYPFAPAMNAAIRTFDYLAIAGMLLAFGLAIHLTRRTGFHPQSVAMLLFVVLGGFLRRTEWLETTDFARILSPLLILLALYPLLAGGNRALRWLPAAPACMVAPGCMLQLASQMFAVLRAVTASVRG